MAVQHLARKAAKGEVEGTDGYFVTKEAFQAMITEGRFAEHREVAGGVLVGTTYEAINKVQVTLRASTLSASSTGFGLPCMELVLTSATDQAPNSDPDVSMSIIRDQLLNSICYPEWRP